jgi:lipoprotein signal peptidase
MQEQTRRSPLIPLLRIALLIAAGDLLTKQVAVLWVGTLEPHVSSAVRFGVVHNDKGAFGLTAGDYTFELSLVLTLAALVLIVPVARDLARIDERAPAALGLIAGGAIGNLVSLLASPAGVVDFIAVQRADGAGIVLNVADIGAYAGVVMLMRTIAMVIGAIRRNRTANATAHAADRGAALNRLTDLEVVRVVARDGVSDDATKSDVGIDRPRPVADRHVNLRVIHADGGPSRPGRTLASRLRDQDGTTRGPAGSAYLRPMSHQAELRRGR